MSVIEKKRDIGILRSMGVTEKSILKIFMFEGLLIGIIGTFLGVIIGYLVCYLQIKYNIYPLDPSQYKIDSLPIEIRFSDFFYISGASMLLAFLASLYPAKRAAKEDPINAISGNSSIKNEKLMNEIILKAENIYKSFQTTKKVKLEVLKGISIEIEKEKITIIVGASGAGKSTLLHLLGGLDRPDSGKVIYHNNDIFKFSDDKLAKFRNQNVGFVFQFHHLLPEFSAIENIMIPQMINGIGLSKAKTKARELLSVVGLNERLDHKPAELSGGEQQRVAFARALANHPKIIFADEPTGNLDSVNSDEIHKLITDLKLKFGMTFVIVTHNQSLVNLADRIYEIKDGKLSTKLLNYSISFLN